jgi:hypothetical protein
MIRLWFRNDRILTDRAATFEYYLRGNLTQPVVQRLRTCPIDRILASPRARYLTSGTLS